MQWPWVPITSSTWRLRVRSISPRIYPDFFRTQVSMNKLAEFLLGIFRGRKLSAAPSPDLSHLNNNTEPARPTISRVLVLVYDPIMDSATARTLSEQQNWHRIEGLAAGFMADISRYSGGMARYHIVQRIDINEFPVKTDSFRYSPQSYMDVLRGVAPPHVPQQADYVSLLTRFRVLERVARNEIDEVWIFAFPHAGFYESAMGGPGAFWCNAPP